MDKDEDDNDDELLDLKKVLSGESSGDYCFPSFDLDECRDSY